jgi:hypothetical protein
MGDILAVTIAEVADVTRRRIFLTREGGRS